MNYKEALELNESKQGIDLDSLTNYQIATVIDQIPGWEYPLADSFLEELANRAGVDMQRYFDRGHDRNDLFKTCTSRLGIRWC